MCVYMNKQKYRTSFVALHTTNPHFPLSNDKYWDETHPELYLKLQY